MMNRKNPLVATIKNIRKEEDKLARQFDALWRKEQAAIMKAAKTLIGKEFTISEPRSRCRHGKFTYRVVAVHKVTKSFGVTVLHYSAELVTKCKNFRRQTVTRKVGKVYRKQISMNRVNLIKVK